MLRIPRQIDTYMKAIIRFTVAGYYWGILTNYTHDGWNNNKTFPAQFQKNL